MKNEKDKIGLLRDIYGISEKEIKDIMKNKGRDDYNDIIKICNLTKNVKYDISNSEKNINRQNVMASIERYHPNGLLYYMKRFAIAGVALFAIIVTIITLNNRRLKNSNFMYTFWVDQVAGEVFYTDICEDLNEISSEELINYINETADYDMYNLDNLNI